MECCIPKSKIAFGWLDSTHNSLGYNAVTDYNQQSGANFDAKEIAKLISLPDKIKHEPGSHSANIKKLRSNDAFDNFKKHDALAKKALKSEDKESLNKAIAFVLHFLQDMMNPYHVIHSPVFSKKEQADHNFFEKSVVREQDKYIEAARQKTNQLCGDFIKILADKMAESRQRAILVLNGSIDNPMFSTIKKNSLADSYHISVEYLKYLANSVK